METNEKVGESSMEEMGENAGNSGKIGSRESAAPGGAARTEAETPPVKLEVQRPGGEKRAGAPRVGLRVLKTVAAATFVCVVYNLIDRNPCFACIGAVFGMGGTLRGGMQSGGNRFIGTLVGGIIAIPFYWLYWNEPGGIPNWAWVAIGMFILLYISQLLGFHGGIQPGAVVFFVVLMTVAEDRFVMYTINRIIDTGLGVLFSLGINTLWPSPLEKEVWKRKKEKKKDA